jgi:dTDP-4-dehydrorhamnose 3,5-epimerase
MDVIATEIPDVKIIRPKKFGDHRGFFSEVFKNDVLNANGIEVSWVQDNHSLSTSRGVLRGLHYQTSPFEQAKLLRVTRGAIIDVAVDIRRGSPTYGRHVAVELSDSNWDQLYIPIGFAHGFCTLTDTTEVIYKVSAKYAPENEGGLMWNDPGLSINWPSALIEPVLSDRDKFWPAFESFRSPFAY